MVIPTRLCIRVYTILSGIVTALKRTVGSIQSVEEIVERATDYDVPNLVQWYGDVWSANGSSPTWNSCTSHVEHVEIVGEPRPQREGTREKSPGTAWRFKKLSKLKRLGWCWPVLLLAYVSDA